MSETEKFIPKDFESDRQYELAARNLESAEKELKWYDDIAAMRDKVETVLDPKFEEERQSHREERDKLLEEFEKIYRRHEKKPIK